MNRVEFVGQQRSFTLGQPKDEAPKREAVSMLGRDDLFGSLFGSEPGTGAFNAPAPSLSMPVSAGVEPKPSEKHKKSKKKDEKKHSSKRKHKRSSSKSKHKSKKHHKDKIKKSKSKKHRYSDSESSSGDSGSDPTGSDVGSASDGEDVDLDDLEAFEKKFMADEMKRVVPPVTSSSGDGGKKVVVVSGLDARGKQIGTLAGLKSGEDTSMPKPSLITYDSDGSITGGLEDGTGKKAKKKLKTDDGAQQQQKDMHQAVALERKLTAAEEKCWYCFRNPAFKRHMMVSMGEHVYLALPLNGSLPVVFGHCCIVPMAHVVCTRDLDEDALNEITKFKLALEAMFKSLGQGVVFMETSMNFHKHRHAYIECVPLDKEPYDDCALYFQKAIVESEEWTLNKTIVDTAGTTPAPAGSKKKPLAASIPPGFAYFHVSWHDGGYVHVIDNEETFPRSFGMDIAKGMLDLPPDRFGRKTQRVTFDDERKQVLGFLKVWKSFDWTVELEGGQ